MLILRRFFWRRGYFLSNLPPLFRSEPFPQYWLRPRRACHPSGSSGGPMLWRRPGSHAAPEKRGCRRGGPERLTARWLARGASNPQLAHPTDDPVYNHSGGGDRPPLRSTGSPSNPMAGRSTVTLTVSGKTAIHVKRPLLLKMW